MRLSFVQTLPFEHMGIMHIAAYVKARGHDCTALVATEHPKDWLARLKAQKPDVVAFSVISGVHNDFRPYMKEIKRELGVPIVWGGPHPTFFPQALAQEPDLDFVCRGEGEIPMARLLDALAAGEDATRVPNLWAKKDGRIHENEIGDLPQMDDLPWVDRTIYYDHYPFIRRSKLKFFCFTRGCPYKCGYCHQHVRQRLYEGKGDFVRLRSVEHLIGELVHVRDKYGLEHIDFIDDTFNVDHAYLRKMLPVYKREVGLPYTCQGIAEWFSDDILDLMVDSGCKAISTAFETGNEKFRSTVLKKMVTTKELIDRAAAIKRRGIKLRTYNILGLPGETWELAMETVDLMMTVRPDIPWASIFQPYPGTDLCEYAKEHGYLEPEFSFDDLDRTFRNASVLVNMPDLPKLVNLQKLFAIAGEHPFLRPWLKVLCSVPPNKLYDLLYYAHYGWTIKKVNHLDSRTLMEVGVRAMKHTT